MKKIPHRDKILFLIFLIWMTRLTNCIYCFLFKTFFLIWHFKLLKRIKSYIWYILATHIFLFLGNFIHKLIWCYFCWLYHAFLYYDFYFNLFFHYEANICMEKLHEKHVNSLTKNSKCMYLLNQNLKGNIAPIPQSLVCPSMTKLVIPPWKYLK